MTSKRLVALLCVGMAAGLLSLTTRWVTFHPASGGPVAFTEWGGSRLGNPDPAIIVMGYDGRVFVPVRARLWWMVSMSIGVAALRLVQLQEQSTAGSALLKCFAVIGAIWMTLVFLLMLVGNRDNLGIGGFLALICAALTVVGSFRKPDPEWLQSSGDRFD
jgi:hypothetical protein